MSGAAGASPLPRVGPSANETVSLAAFGGLEITDIDASRPLPASARARVLAAFRAYPVLVFRGQLLTKEQQYAFTLHFGEIEDQHVGRHVDRARYTPVHQVSNLDENGHPTDKLRERGSYFWHSDKSYHAIPSLMTMLHAVQLPPAGGETQFAHTAAAYDALDAQTRARVHRLRVVHSWEASRLNCGAPPATEEQKRERPPVEHPLVRVHPETRRLALYLGNHASHIVGLDKAHGRALLRDLLAHCTQPRFVYTHVWRPGDLVLWDNRCLLHRALPHPGMSQHRRVLHRTVVRGTVPAAP